MAAMAFRLALLVLVVAVAAMAMAARADDDYAMDVGLIGEPDGHGIVADALDFDEELMMESESARRQLWGRHRGHISYAALRRNNVPCNRRGHSYYNCRGHQAAHPYKRGCTRATRCARNNR
ncbi:hypothetical protein ACP275_13G080000 [Erythranthe tilingii]